MRKRNVTPLFTQPLASEITSPEVFAKRRKILRLLAAGAATPALAHWAMRDAKASMMPSPNRRQMLSSIPSSIAGANLDEAITPYDDATTYNNFYEFGLDKGDPAKHADAMPISPWSVNIEGLVHKPGVWSLEDLLSLSAMEERIYRLRCVEAWSMVIPWVGYSLAELIKKVEPMGSAKYVEFVTMADPQSMPGLRSGVLDWPYTEGLRMDEAMHPLTMLTFGMYGEVLPNQNGAPVRLVVPWKYGFKSAKSIVSIRFVEEMPATAWNKAARHEYGFYSNVNPDVPHRRWSQSSERVIGQSGFFGPKRKTEMFNGYAEQVGQLYAGMDLTRNF